MSGYNKNRSVHYRRLDASTSENAAHIVVTLPSATAVKHAPTGVRLDACDDCLDLVAQYGASTALGALLPGARYICGDGRKRCKDHAVAWRGAPSKTARYVEAAEFFAGIKMAERYKLERVAS